VTTRDTKTSVGWDCAITRAAACLCGGPKGNGLMHRSKRCMTVVDGCRPDGAEVALAIGPMDFSDSPHVAVGVTNHHFAPAVAADGHIFEERVHSAGPLGNLVGVHAEKA
jgi:hypothetical protein